MLSVFACVWYLGYPPELPGMGGSGEHYAS